MEVRQEEDAVLPNFLLLLLYLITDFLERLNEVVVLGFACVVDDGDLLVVN